MQLLALLVLISTATAVLIPAPDGPYPVSVYVKALTDGSRIDPYAPKNDHHQRQVVVSLFLPIDRKQTPFAKTLIPYMTPAVAEEYGKLAVNAGLPNNTFAAFDVQTNIVVPERSCGLKRPSEKKSKVHLVLLSPGGGQSRLLYSTMARSLASEGYAVVTIDHPYDATVVEFPDGKVIRAPSNSDEDFPALTKMTQVRAQDVSFVLDELNKPKTFAKELASHNVAVDFSRVLMYGHSQGGATAALAMLSDSRIKGGINMDGRFFGAVMTKALSRPFLLLGRPNHGAEDGTWRQTFPKFRGSRFEMEVADTMHGSFTDFPALVDSLNLPEKAREGAAMLFGAASSKQMDKTVKGVVTALSELIFSDKAIPAVLKKGQKQISGLRVLRSDVRK
ncbi:platelet-activating factor acetylhydrolase, isoform II domain-containing protein [Sarocladium implicatum]|nr:platelet-activating factor acetylhydrolase, isoform II domain-containing protein [Sarocladium implicatum]